MNADSNVLLLPLCFFGLYMILEAADWGLCLAAPLVSRNNDENRAILGLLKPGLDGNELWYFLGFFMMGAAVPEAMKNLSQTGSLALIVFIVAGALLRLAACVARNAFSRPVVMKLMSLFSLVALVVMGLTGSSFLMRDGSVFSVLGIFCALWIVLAAFQLGTLYGAVKVVNPLGERFRAAFLVSSVLTVVVYIILAILLKNHAGDSNMYGSFFWISLVATAILFVIAFFFTRMRHAGAGLVAVYLSSFFAIAIYLSAYAAVIPQVFPVEVESLKNAMDGMPGTALLVVAFVWTLGAFIWRMCRRKEVYEWKDHI
ncbi:cytochrome d ubiquinol oxidase subunit II [uncultured Dialister sp.]|uniref:cytochrome d ubiquinol oxidase subunit II n=1 Tax=uncultured Dialister sp. TaxID=278064 RepID=UPI002605BB42|nr:cytochrome d ubiquinol oxidase subunit II [uncultured Dialister sp.]